MNIEEQNTQAEHWVAGNFRLRTKKGAAFVGYAEAMYYNPVMKHYGIVLVAGEGDFGGTTHVYPVTQLETA